jgi:hypothetical protein
MSPAPESLFDPSSVGKRIDYAVGSVVAQVSPGDRERWEARLSGAGRDNLKTAVAVWYGAGGLSRDAFRARLLDPNVSDGAVPGVMKASATSPNVAVTGAVLLGGILPYLALRNREQQPGSTKQKPMPRAAAASEQAIIVENGVPVPPFKARRPPTF